MRRQVEAAAACLFRSKAISKASAHLFPFEGEYQQLPSSQQSSCTFGTWGTYHKMYSLVRSKLPANNHRVNTFSWPRNAGSSTLEDMGWSESPACSVQLFKIDTSRNAGLPAESEQSLGILMGPMSQRRASHGERIRRQEHIGLLYSSATCSSSQT